MAKIIITLPEEAELDLKKRRLGRTGLEVSLMGGIPIQRINKEEAAAVLEAAISSGINFFDTARGYSDSEEKFGSVLGPRHSEVIIATKSMVRTKEAMAVDIKTSLKNLQVALPLIVIGLATD